MKDRELYNKAIQKWGERSQVKMAIEECAELIKALAKYDRNNNGSTIDEILEEMADVEIMIEQLKIIFNYKYSNDTVDKFKEIKRQKLERLEKLVMEEENHALHKK